MCEVTCSTKLERKYYSALKILARQRVIEGDCLSGNVNCTSYNSLWEGEEPEACVDCWIGYALDKSRENLI